MSTPVLPPARFRHLVFPTEAGRRRRVIDFAAHGGGPTLAGATPEPGLSDEQAAFGGWLFAQAGLDARAYRPETLRRRLAACLRGLRVRSLDEARAALEGCPERVAAAISTMLVGVTAFFRDGAVFDALARDLLPPLAAGRPGLHVWSAGCSDGAELYSLGMLFAERGWLAGSYLLGTDCRPDAIVRARRGRFEPAACKGVPPHLLARYFASEGGHLRAVAALRSSLRWRVADLLRVQEPGVWDVILCRNTTMYLRAEATAELWQRIEALLRPGGVLVLGKAERPVGTKRLLLTGPCVYRRIRG